MHTEAERAICLVHVIQYTADELKKTVTETAPALLVYKCVLNF